MKRSFFSCVMVVSLLLAVGGCGQDVSPGYVTELEEGKPGTPEAETPEVIPPEVETPGQGTQGGGTNEGGNQGAETPAGGIQEAALLQINELRTEYTNSGTRPEYIEFKAIKGGNLGGMKLHIMNDAQEPFIYAFPPINVEKGEYITLHLRNLEGGCIDELGKDLSLSGGADSCPTARDLWVPGSKKLIYKTDIVYIKDNDRGITDAVVMSENPAAGWNANQAHFTEITLGNL